MLIDHKYFPADKNHLLKTVQAFSKDVLLEIWTRNAFEGFMMVENPLGLEDSFTQSIRNDIIKGKDILDEVYDLLAAVYRFRYGSNQLTFMWDGRTHMEFYDQEWRDCFEEWTKKLSTKPEVYRAIIKAALATEGTNTDFLKSSIRRTILKDYKIKLSRSQRIAPMAVSA